MIQVTRSRQIAAQPDAVFATLADPDNLAGVVPHVHKIELVERGASHARVVTHMAIGPFGDLRSEGTVRWQTNREVVFNTTRPVPVEERWQLRPNSGGTALHATLSLDLAALIGPLAAFVPTAEVARMIAPDLDTALAAIASRAEMSLQEAI